MQHFDDIYRDTQALVHPHPVEPFEREAAGFDEEPLAFSTWSWHQLLACIAFSLILWTASFELLRFLTPYIMWWFE